MKRACKHDHALIGPAATVMAAVRELVNDADRAAVLLDGAPGVGKTAVLDRLAMEICGTEFAIERVNGQSLSVDLVRTWRERSRCGNLFADWTIKRVDEIDQASSSAVAELLTLLDYLPARVAILTTTNEYEKLRAQTKGRLETRFHRFHVDAPTVAETAAHLVKLFRLPKAIARQIAEGAVPDGCLPTEGCNMRAAIKDAQSFTAARAAQGRRAA